MLGCESNYRKYSRKWRVLKHNFGSEEWIYEVFNVMVHPVLAVEGWTSFVARKKDFKIKYMK